jgi:hypothetical protein
MDSENSMPVEAETTPQGSPTLALKVVERPTVTLVEMATWAGPETGFETVTGPPFLM